MVMLALGASTYGLLEMRQYFDTFVIVQVDINALWNIYTEITKLVPIGILYILSWGMIIIWNSRLVPQVDVLLRYLF
jgi:phage-related minor tail protein